MRTSDLILPGQDIKPVPTNVMGDAVIDQINGGGSASSVPGGKSGARAFSTSTKEANWGFSKPSGRRGFSTSARSFSNQTAPKPRTMFDKIWDEHTVNTQDDGTGLLYIDRHLVHEVTSPQAFEGLRNAGRQVPHTTLHR